MRRDGCADVRTVLRTSGTAVRADAQPPLPVSLTRALRSADDAAVRQLPEERSHVVDWRRGYWEDHARPRRARSAAWRQCVQRVRHQSGVDTRGVLRVLGLEVQFERGSADVEE